MGETKILVLRDGKVSRKSTEVGGTHHVVWLSEQTGAKFTVSFKQDQAPFEDWNQNNPVQSGEEVRGLTFIRVGPGKNKYKYTVKIGRSVARGRPRAQDPEIIVDGGGGDPGNPKPGKRKSAKAKKPGAKKR